MTFDQGVNKVADLAENPWFKIIVGPVFVALVVAAAFGLLATLQDHSTTLAKMSVTLQDLSEGQKEIKQTVETKIGTIVDVQSEQRAEISALQQSIKDGPLRERPR